MKKLVGYILAGVGIFGLAITFNPIKTILNLPIPSGLTDTTITIVSLLLAAAGIVILAKFSEHTGKEKEVPIYKEKEVVGFRRIKH